MMTNPLHNFVSYPLCCRLAEHGLTRNTWAVWREYLLQEMQNQWYLMAPGLDWAGVYGQLDLPEGVKSAEYLDTPAYTLLDMLRCIPLFRLEEQDPMHRHISSRLGICGLDVYTSDEPLPDLAARKALQLIEGGRLSVELMNNEMLTHPLYIK